MSLVSRPAADEVGAAIHAGLLRGDAAAPARLYEAYYEAILAALGARYPTTSPDLIEDAAARAFASYAERPGQYDPAKRGLRGFLYMAADGDLRNLLQSERRRAAVPIDGVALHALPRNNDVEDAVEALADAERNAELERKLVRLVADPVERRVLVLMREGVRDTAAYAEAMGIADRPEPEQRLRAKQIKDRLKKRLLRSDLFAGRADG